MNIGHAGLGFDVDCILENAEKGEAIFMFETNSGVLGEYFAYERNAIMLPQAALAALMTVTSPDSKNTLTVAQDGDKVVYSVTRNGQELLAPTPIDFEVKGLTPATQAKVSTFVKDLSADVPFYTKRSRITLTANGATADFGGRTLTVMATDQGVAYRWGTTLSSEAEVRSETFSLAPKGEPELLYAYNNTPHRKDLLQNSFESPHQRGKLSGIDPKRLVYLPITLLYKGAAMAVTEAELRDYPGLNLRRPDGDSSRLVQLMATLPTAEDGGSRRYSFVTARTDYLVRTQGTRQYPWRIFMLADTPAGLYDNDLVMALSEPAKGDFSWVKPGKVAWEWWNNWGLDNVPFKPGVNTETYKAYIDFASAYGIPYVIMDEGWAVKLDVMNVIPQIDMAAIIAHAKAKGVGIVLWCTWLQLIGRQEEILGHYAKMGVVGFKIDFIDRDDAKVADFIYKTAEVAAKHRLLVAYHGVHKPTGVSRTFPNVLAYEGVWGLEQAKWTGNGIDFITNDIRIAFTRLLAGPMDFTPGAMHNAPRATFRACNARPMSMGTRARQAALFVLYDTNFQMLCDSPSAYDREPSYTRFLASVPQLWDSTTCDPSSEPDSRLLVRRTKGKDVWYAALAGNGRQHFEMPLRGLEGIYEATILRDSAISANVGTDYILETRTVTAKDTLKVTCEPGGGFLIRLTPKGK